MRASISRIRQALLHPHPEIRLAGLRYFTDAFTTDQTVMPLVIQAVQRYGKPTAVRLLRAACYLPQTSPTVAWLVEELREYSGSADPESVEYRWALAMILHHARLDLLLPHGLHLAAPGWLPAELRRGILERYQMAGRDWMAGWKALAAAAGEAASGQHHQRERVLGLHRIIESMGRHRATRGEWVLSLLRQPTPRQGQVAARYLQRLTVRLAGQMGLATAIPLLAEHLHGQDTELVAECCCALRKIGSDAVIERIAAQWWDADNDFRAWAIGVLDCIHSDPCVQRCLEFLAQEGDLELQRALGHCLLSNLAHEGIVPVRRLLLAGSADYDLKQTLVVAATIMGTRFPEYLSWHQETLEGNGGWPACDRQTARGCQPRRHKAEIPNPALAVP